MASQYRDLPYLTWRPPVANAAALPATGNLVGDAIITQDTLFIYVWSGSAWVLIGGGGTGTVTSVGLAAPAIFSVSGSPVTTSGTLTLTANGTSGGIPYFNASNTMASSGALTQYQVILGGGAGGAPNVVSGTGTSGQVLTSNGAGTNPTWQAVAAAFTWTALSSNITLAANTGYFVSTAAARSLTLPAPVNGLTIFLKDASFNAFTNNITLLQHASEKIEGVAASYVIQANGAAIQLVSNGTDWFVTN